MSCGQPGLYARTTVPPVSSDGISEKVFSETDQKGLILHVVIKSIFVLIYS